MRLYHIWIVLSVFVLASCASSDGDYASLPIGDATRGEVLYTESINGAPTCSACHALSDEALVGPSLAGYGDLAASRVEGQSAEDYTYNAILRPAVHIVQGYGNVMYTEYGFKLSDQDTADLIAFLLTQ